LIYENQTALITGASSGIGAEFASQLASKGADLVLVARRLDRLNSIASELRAKYARTVTVLDIDLTSTQAIEKVIVELKKRSIDIDILVNNAGFGNSGMFIDDDLLWDLKQIELNVKTLVTLTHAFLPDMVNRNRGTVINLASTAAFQPVPTMAVYGATKAFVLSFTEAIWAEVGGTEVKVIALCPGATETEFFDVAQSRGTGALRQTPQEVVTVVFDELSKPRIRPSIVSGFRNKFISKIPRFVTRGFMSKLSLKAMSTD
jgi:short-subunit dehydrogenase